MKTGISIAAEGEGPVVTHCLAQCGHELAGVLRPEWIFPRTFCIHHQPFELKVQCALGKNASLLIRVNVFAVDERKSPYLHAGLSTAVDKLLRQLFLASLFIPFWNWIRLGAVRYLDDDVGDAGIPSRLGCSHRTLAHMCQHLADAPHKESFALQHRTFLPFIVANGVRKIIKLHRNAA